MDSEAVNEYDNTNRQRQPRIPSQINLRNVNKRRTKQRLAPAKDHAGARGEEPYTLTQADYIRANPEDEIEESSKITTHDGTLAVADLEGGESWFVRVGDTRKKVEIKDSVFLEQVRRGGKVNNENLYTMMIQEDRVKKERQDHVNQVDYLAHQAEGVPR